ncbi:hypothetical protein J3R30DRAFT_1780457 [Lentinula aciculospora]|uniref:Inhibitor I9 domain-containing protein n=1 Tax=Lentinula aciculospora TaxID=153920 RepID=A0A9W9DRV2_9AGAR|nr:hypothetical protein J3R30DRAFT_1780457 [Lentinula aciculospora]
MSYRVLVTRSPQSMNSSQLRLRHSPRQTMLRPHVKITIYDFVIIFKDGVSKDEIQKFKDDVTSEGGELGDTYEGPISGFSANIQPQTLLDFLVQACEPDSVIKRIELKSVVTTQ